MDARRGLVRPLHDHARQHDRERGAAVDPELARTSRSPSSSGSSTGYALTFGAFMLTGGKLADLFGRRLIFVVGLADLHALVARLRARRQRDDADRARASCRALGAALMNPATLSIITVTFPPRQRGTAIGIWAGVSALALAIGPLVGGLITEHINWNWIFFINIPVGVARRSSPRSRSSTSRATPRTSSGPTCPGLVTSALGLFALSYGLIEANNYGWTSARILVAFAVAAVALVAFVLLELHQRLPMLDLVALPQPRLRRRERGDAARRRSRCSASSSTSRSTCSRCSATRRSQAGRELPAVDGADHPARAAGGPAVRPDRPAPARRRRDGRARGLARSLLAHGRRTRPSGRSCPAMILGGDRHVGGDGADDGGGDGLGARRTRRASARRC